MELNGLPLASHHALHFPYLGLSHHLEIAHGGTDSVIPLSYSLASAEGLYIPACYHVT